MSTVTVTDEQALGAVARDGNIRVTRAVHLPTSFCEGDAGYDMWDWLADALAALGWANLDEDEHDELMDTLYAECRVEGWIIEVETPVPFSFSENGRSYGFTWGHCWLNHFHGATYAEAVQAAATWADEQRDQERAAIANRQD